SSEGFDPVTQAAEPATRCECCATDTVVDDQHGHLSVPVLDVDSRAGGLCVFRRVCERLGCDEVDSRLDVGRQAFARDIGDLDRNVGAACEGRQRWLEAVFAQKRRVEAPGEGTNVRERALDFGIRLVEQLVDLRIRRDTTTGELQRKAAREQPLLCAVVEVAFEPASFIVAGGENARTRRAYLGQLCAQLCLQAYVLEAQPG